MPRPIFSNEIIGPINGSNDPQYEITGGLNCAKIKLLNPIIQEGTPVNSNNLNLLYNFDNLEGQPGFIKETPVPDGTGNLTTSIVNAETSKLAAKRITTFNADGSITKTTFVYADDGITVLRRSVVTTTFPQGFIAKEVAV